MVCCSFFRKCFNILPTFKFQTLSNNSLKVSSSGKSEIINELKYNHAKTKGHFGIEVPLRGIESFFNWATDKDKEIEFEKLLKVKYMVSKLHSSLLSYARFKTHYRKVEKTFSN